MRGSLSCEVAKHYDYVWFEMQHATLSFRDVEEVLPTLKKRRNLDAWSTAGGAAPVTGWPAASSG